ncbi:tail completion protein gp17 [Telmatobacter bradus]|uniref:tail completion protein gp17 n=1 Tax=Telmatobacter bradus TaxID=474953 RepID=UPI003B434560
MSLSEGIVAQLTASNGGDAIDTYVSGRIFYDDAPPDMSMIPCITYAFVGGSASAPTFNTSGVIKSRLELNALAVQPDAANNLQPGEVANAIRSAIIQRLNGWKQTLSDGTNVLSAILVNPGTDFSTEQRVFRRMCEFRISYSLPS